MQRSAVLDADGCRNGEGAGMEHNGYAATSQVCVKRASPRSDAECREDPTGTRYWGSQSMESNRHH